MWHPVDTPRTKEPCPDRLGVCAAHSDDVTLHGLSVYPEPHISTCLTEVASLKSIIKSWIPGPNNTGLKSPTGTDRL